MDINSILIKSLLLAKEYTPRAEYMAFVDFSRDASLHRFFLINLKAKVIEYDWYTSHGSGSGSLVEATKFSNTPNSRMSSKGLLKTGNTYQGKYGLSLKLHGLEKGVNDNVERRSIVIHRSAYVSRNYMKSHHYPGRSWGCITLDPDRADDVINKLKDGSLVYIYTS